MRTALVIAAEGGDRGRLASRVPAFIHPVAGRPLIWHTINALLSGEEPAERVIVLIPEALSAVFAENVPTNVRILDPSSPEVATELAELPERVLVADGNACLEASGLRKLRRLDAFGWLGSAEDVAAVVAGADQARAMVTALQLEVPSSGGERIAESDSTFNVRTRADLARMQTRIRDRIVAGQMDAGATFLLPHTVLIDVDVRIGRDTVVYPGVVLEGQTTIGEETVIGPGCRVIDSWVGSGVELKGWNYISNTSVRNRAILEPYVRRGFD